MSNATKTGRPKNPPRTVIYKGEKHELGKLAKEKGMKPNTVKGRIDRGWTVEDAIDKPAKKGFANNEVGLIAGHKGEGKGRIGPARQLKNYLLDRIRGAIATMPEDEFEGLIHDALRNDFLGTIKELGPGMPKDELGPKYLSAHGANGVTPHFNIDKAVFANPADYEPI